MRETLTTIALTLIVGLAFAGCLATRRLHELPADCYCPQACD